VLKVLVASAIFHRVRVNGRGNAGGARGASVNVLVVKVGGGVEFVIGEGVGGERGLDFVMLLLLLLLLLLWLLSAVTGFYMLRLLCVRGGAVVFALVFLVGIRFIVKQRRRRASSWRCVGNAAG